MPFQAQHRNFRHQLLLHDKSATDSAISAAPSSDARKDTHAMNHGVLSCNALQVTALQNTRHVTREASCDAHPPTHTYTHLLSFMVNTGFRALELLFLICTTAEWLVMMSEKVCA